MRKISLISVIVLTASVVITTISCRDRSVANNSVLQSTQELRVARGNGFSFAALYTAEKLGLLEKYLPGVKVEISVTNENAMNESFAANRLDIAFMGFGNPMIAWDKGIEIQIISGSVNMVHEFNVRPGINSLKDFTPSDKIAVSGIGTSYQIWLAMACEREFGDSRALENNLVVMSHPDSFTALVNGAIAGHFTQLPYIAREREAGFKSLLNIAGAFGGDATNVIIASKKLCSESPLIVDGFLNAIEEAICLINKRDPRSLTIIAEMEKLSLEEVNTFLDWDGMNYSTALYGWEGLIDFMYKQGYISKKPSLEDLCWYPVLAHIGKRSGEPSVLEKALKKQQ